MVSFSPHPSERRQALRFAIEHRSRLRLTLDLAAADSETINGVTLTDISQDGLMAADAGQLLPGALIVVDVPLVGWRDVEVMWIADNRAGCRFLEPLNLDELRMAAASSERLALECPGFSAEISRLPLLPESAQAVIGDDPPQSPRGRRPIIAILTIIALVLIVLAATIV